MSICTTIFKDFFPFGVVLFPSVFAFAKSAESTKIIGAEDAAADMHIPGLIQGRHRIFAAGSGNFEVWIFFRFFVRNEKEMHMQIL